ncbi:MAG: TraB/GumN family protein [Cyclobacteriaceae bacterium]
MRHRIPNAILFASFILTLTMCAQPQVSRTDTGSSEAQQETATDAPEKSLLYRISGNGLQQPSYLYGTIHIICPADFTVPDYVKGALEEAEVTVLELDMDDPSFMQQMQQNMVSPDMSNFAQNMDEADREKLDATLKKQYGPGIDQLGIMKPFVIQNMILVKYLPCEQQASYEAEFIQLSEAQEQEVIGLETVAFQFSVFDQIPAGQQVEWITEMLNDSVGTINKFGEMVEVYKQKDVEGLNDLMLQDDQFDEYADLLLYDRNANWIPKMEQIMSEQSAFIAVGAGHLGGDKGVLALLEGEGYTVEPVTE